MRHLRCTGCAVLGHRGLTKRYRPPAQGLAPKYTVADVALLAETDAPHSGPATQNLLQRALLVFGDTRTARLASISVAHLYHLRGAAGYRARRQQGPRRAPPASIGERRGRSWPLGERLRGYLPVIKAMLEGFPFTISGFHADNGSEYINHQVAGRLEKLRTRPRVSPPPHKNNTPPEKTKSAAVRPNSSGNPPPLILHHQHHLLRRPQPSLNFHRPCLFAEDTI